MGGFLSGAGGGNGGLLGGGKLLGKRRRESFVSCLIPSLAYTSERHAPNMNPDYIEIDEGRFNNFERYRSERCEACRGCSLAFLPFARSLSFHSIDASSS